MRARKESGRRPRLLIFNQYYKPGVEATAQLLAELCETLADEYEIRVLTGRVRGRPGEARRTMEGGVEVIRLRSTTFERARLGLRALNYLTYLGLALLRGFFSPRPDLVLCMTDPPLVGDVALLVARRFRAPLFVISEDVFPEIAVKLRRLQSPLLVGVLGRLIHFYLRRADLIVAIGETMKSRLEEKGVSPQRIRVVPNWVDTIRISPHPRENPWAAAQKLTGKFVVMHSGNVGHAQNLDALIRATTFLRDLERLLVVVIGFGARFNDIARLADLLEADKVRFLPYQPRDMLPQSLSAADIHYVGLVSGLAGYVVPSRLYGILATARPVIAAADAQSETAQVVSSVGCGVVVPPTRPELVAAAIRDAHDGRYDLEEMGRLGRAHATAEADRAVVLARYRGVLRELLSGG